MPCSDNAVLGRIEAYVATAQKSHAAGKVLGLQGRALDARQESEPLENC